MFKIPHSALLAALALTVGAGAATAQTAPAARDRSEVKAEAVKARKDGTLPQGEAPAKEPKFQSGKSRQQRKDETRAAVARGEVTSRGEADTAREPVSRGSNRARDEVKAEARTATKSGDTRIGNTYPDRKK